MRDHTAEITISAEPTDVAAIMFDPNREAEWQQQVSGVEVLDPGIKPGARVRHAGLLAQAPFTWTTEVVTFHFPHVLNLRLVEGPLQGVVAYGVGRARGGSTARIQVRLETGNDLGPDAVATLVGALTGSLPENLARLKTLVEGAAA